MPITSEEAESVIVTTAIQATDRNHDNYGQHAFPLRPETMEPKLLFERTAFSWRGPTVF
jgi:hypothetical protein